MVSRAVIEKAAYKELSDHAQLLDVWFGASYLNVWILVSCFRSRILWNFKILFLNAQVGRFLLCRKNGMKKVYLYVLLPSVRSSDYASLLKTGKTSEVSLPTENYRFHEQPLSSKLLWYLHKKLMSKVIHSPCNHVSILGSYPWG